MLEGAGDVARDATPQVRLMLNYFRDDLPMLPRTVSLNIDKKEAVFKVSKLKDIIDVIIPHFDKYPLQGVKCIDYNL